MAGPARVHGAVPPAADRRWPHRLRDGPFRGRRHPRRPPAEPALRARRRVPGHHRRPGGVAPSPRRQRQHHGRGRSLPVDLQLPGRRRRERRPVRVGLPRSRATGSAGWCSPHRSARRRRSCVPPRGWPAPTSRGRRARWRRRRAMAGSICTDSTSRPPRPNGSPPRSSASTSRDGLRFGSMAVFVRSKRRFVAELSRALSRRGIAHEPPSSRTTEQPEVRFLLDLVAAATTPETPKSPVVARHVRHLLLGPWFGLTLGQVRDVERAHATTGHWVETLRTRFPELAALLADDRWATTAAAAEGAWAVWESLPQLAAIATGDEHRGSRRAWASLLQVLTRWNERNPAGRSSSTPRCSTRSPSRRGPWCPTGPRTRTR